MALARDVHGAVTIPLKGLARPDRWQLAWKRLRDGSGLTRVVRSLRRRRVEQRLRRAGGSR
jgi:hypothetical protein